MLRRISLLIYCLYGLRPEAFVTAQVVTDSAGANLRLIEGGRFVQGTSGGERVLSTAFPLSTAGQFYGNAEEPAHVTWITKPFYLAETEVTVGQFKKFVAATRYVTSAEKADTEMVGWDPTSEDKPLYESHDFLRDGKFNWKNPGFPQQDDHPVVGVSWRDAKAYCDWLSEQESVRYRLPTEAEWELACRAGTSTWFSFGDRAKNVVHRFGNLGNVELEKHRPHAAERQWLLDFENDPEDGHVFTAPVGSYEANAWGLKDMHGNAWEWCEDLWLDTVYNDYKRPRYDAPVGVAVDPVNTDRPQTPANNFQAIRGGCWYNGDLICRSAGRTYWDRDDAACYIGFRVARDVDLGASTAVKERYDKEQLAIQKIESAGGTLYSSGGLDIEVRFEGEAFDESALKSLKFVSNLERLRIGWRARESLLTQAGLDTIAALAELRELEFRSSLNVETVDFSVLSRLPQLEVLRFPRDAAFKDEHLLSLSGLTSLIEFQCFGTNGGLTDSGISALAGNRQLETLSVFENQATGKFLKDFVGCPLQSFTSTRLYNGDGMMTDEYASQLREFPELRSLSLNGQSHLGGATMKSIGGLTQLRSLSLEECRGFNDEDYTVVGGLQRLQSLNLLYTEAGASAAEAISQIPRLQTLRLGSDRITDESVEQLARAFSIAELQIASNKITDKGVQSLGRINRLQRLTLVSDRVTGTGLGPVARLPELRDLSLITSSLTDVAFDYLSRARSIQKLKLAHRGYQPPSALTNVGLMKMSRATWMKEFWLPRNDTQMTEEKMNELNAVMPKTNVIVYTVDWKRGAE